MSTPSVKRFPIFGLIALAAPLLGLVAAFLVLQYAEGGPREPDMYVILGSAGPTVLVRAAHLTFGSIAFAGFLAGGIALLRSERWRALAVIGMIFDFLLSMPVFWCWMP